jgi:hypothetical protein
MSQVLRDRHRPPPNHAPQRGVLEAGAGKDKEVEDVVRRAKEVEYSWSEVFRKASGALGLSAGTLTRRRPPKEWCW